MIIRYRNYSFPTGSTSYTDEAPNDFTDGTDQQGNALKFRSNTTRRITLDGWIIGDDAADLKTKVAAFEQAFSVDGGDFTVTSPAGVEVCAIRPADTATGLRVALRSYPDGKGIEWVTRRTFRIVLECEYAVANAGGIDGATQFSQSISYVGTGGPRFVVVETMDGMPIRQQVAARTRCSCTQQGTAASRIRQLTPPGPIYPEHEKQDLRQITPPDSQGQISWQYFFESVGPFG